MTSLRRSLLLLPALAVLATGCVPNVTWLPDGSGFVFTEKAGRRLVHYDVKTKQRHVLDEDTGTRTMWPAVSPDGKRVAVAHWLREKDQPDRLQIIVYLLGGGVEWRSTSFPLESSRTSSTQDGDTFLLWGSADRILVAARHTAWYDLRKDALIPIEGCRPFTLGSAMRPDGKGFLALRDGERGEQFAFVDLAGKAHPLPGKPPALDDGPLYPLRWHNHVAVLSGPSGVLEIDTQRRTARERPAEVPPLLPAPGKLTALHLYPGGRTVCCVFECTENRGGQQVTYQRIEWQEPRARQRRVLVERCEMLPLVFPSPDRARAALRYSAGGEPRVLVIDAAGKAVTALGAAE